MFCCILVPADGPFDHRADRNGEQFVQRFATFDGRNHQKPLCHIGHAVTAGFDFCNQVGSVIDLMGSAQKFGVGPHRVDRVLHFMGKTGHHLLHVAFL